MIRTRLEESGAALDISFWTTAFLFKGEIVQQFTAWSKALFSLIATLLVVPNSSALKNDRTEVDNMSGSNRIKVWLFSDHTDGRKKITGNFVGVTLDTLIIDADRPRNRSSITKQSIKQVAIGRRSQKKLWFAASFLTIPLVNVSMAFVAAPPLTIILAPRKTSVPSTATPVGHRPWTRMTDHLWNW